MLDEFPLEDEIAPICRIAKALERIADAIEQASKPPVLLYKGKPMNTDITA